jgi:hypothetical protein
VRQSLSEARIGDSLLGVVTEVLSDGALIVSFNGRLVRVQNETRTVFAIDQRVRVIVRAINPLSFQLPDARRQLDRSV